MVSTVRAVSIQSPGIPNKSSESKTLVVESGLFAGIKALLSGGGIMDFAGKIVEAAIKDPTAAGGILRQGTKLSADLTKAFAQLQVENADNGITVEEETTTKRKSGPTGTTVTTTTTTTTTTDAAKHAKFQALVAERIEKLGAGIEGGQIVIGDEKIPFTQFINLFTAISTLASSAKKEDATNETEKGVIDIKPDESVQSAGSTDVSPSAPDLEPIAAVVRSQLPPGLIDSLKALTGSLTNEQVGLLVKQVLNVPTSPVSTDEPPSAV